MRYAVVDIGSNSVRLMLSDDGVTGKKEVITTRLAEGMRDDKLDSKAMQRTVAAVSFLCGKAKECGADVLWVFATAAVRRAKNREEFLNSVYDECGVGVDVVSGETEGRLGYVGALGDKDGAIVDVGGASTEVLVVKDGVPIYVKSVDVGAVSVKDFCGQDKGAVERFVGERVNNYGSIPDAELFAIGGTATSVAAILQELEPYSPEKVDGFIVRREQLYSLKEKLFSLSVDDRKKLKGLRPERAEIIACGVAVLIAVVDKVGADKIVVSEKDNLEGYLKLKRGRI